MDARIEEVRDKLGDFPRTELMRISKDRRISVELEAAFYGGLTIWLASYVVAYLLGYIFDGRGNAPKV